MEKFSYANLSTAEGQREVFGRKADYNNVHHYKGGGPKLSHRDVNRTLKFMFNGVGFDEARTFQIDMATQLCEDKEGNLAPDLRQVTVELRSVYKRYWRRGDHAGLYVLVCIYRNLDIPSGEGEQT